MKDHPQKGNLSSLRKMHSLGKKRGENFLDENPLDISKKRKENLGSKIKKRQRDPLWTSTTLLPRNRYNSWKDM